MSFGFLGIQFGFALLVYYLKLEKKVYILAGGLGVFGFLELVSGALIKGGQEKSGLVNIITELYHMPLTMKQLAIVQFFSWFALFSMWIYIAPAATILDFMVKPCMRETVSVPYSPEGSICWLQRC